MEQVSRRLKSGFCEVRTEFGNADVGSTALCGPSRGLHHSSRGADRKVKDAGAAASHQVSSSLQGSICSIVGGPASKSYITMWQFPKIGAPFLVVLIIRALLFGDLYWEP